MARGYPGIVSALISLPFLLTGVYTYLFPHNSFQIPGATVSQSDVQLIGGSLLAFGIFIFGVGLYIQFVAPSSPTLQSSERIVDRRMPSQRVAFSKALLSVPFFAVTLYLLFNTVVPYMYPTGSFVAGLYFFSSGIKTYWVNTLTLYVITSNRIISEYRFISLRRQEIPLSKIRGIEERKSILETFAGLGNIWVASGGGGGSVRVNMKNIEKSSQFASRLRELVN